MASRSTVSVGNKGEQYAVEYLKNKGYKIISQHYRYQRGEIDIIARITQLLVFVEVKANCGTLYGEPEERVDKKKQEQLSKVARGYIFDNKIENVDFRFDVIGIKMNSDLSLVSIKQFEDAFWANRS